jgi:hypothetical protein
MANCMHPGSAAGMVERSNHWSILAAVECASLPVDVAPRPLSTHARWPALPGMQ